MLDNIYLPLEKVARQLNLPQQYLRRLTEAGEIPHLKVGGRLRYQLKSVQAVLLRLEQKSVENFQIETKPGPTKGEANAR